MMRKYLLGVVLLFSSNAYAVERHYKIRSLHLTEEGIVVQALVTLTDGDKSYFRQVETIFQPSDELLKMIQDESETVVLEKEAALRDDVSFDHVLKSSAIELQAK